jgi:hypothetical protein
LLAQGWLLDTEKFSGSSDMAVLGDGNEIAKVT